MSYQYDANVTPGDLTVNARFKKAPMPTKAELLARCSFPSVNTNKYLNRMIRSGK